MGGGGIKGEIGSSRGMRVRKMKGGKEVRKKVVKEGRMKRYH